MNDIVGIDDENCIDLEILQEKLGLAKKVVRWNTHRSFFDPIIPALMALQIEPRFGHSFDINFTGDKKKLITVCQLLHGAGFSTVSDPPATGDTGWYAWFTAKGCDVQLWLSFTSALCRRIQTGTKMEEVPIYKTVCGPEQDGEIETSIDTALLE